MKKWKLVVSGLLLSLLLGLTAMAAPEAAEDVTLMDEDADRTLIGVSNFSGQTYQCRVSVIPWDSAYEEDRQELLPMPTAEEMSDFGIPENAVLHKVRMKFGRYYNDGSLTTASKFGMDGYVRMRFAVPGVTKDSAVTILSCPWQMEEWVKEGVDYDTMEIGDGYVEADFYNTAPAIIAVYEKTGGQPSAPDTPDDVSEPAGLAGGNAVIKNSTGEETAVTVTADASGEALSSETVKSLTGFEQNYTVHIMDVKLWNEGNEVTLQDGQSVELQFRMPGRSS